MKLMKENRKKLRKRPKYIFFREYNDTQCLIDLEGHKVVYSKTKTCWISYQT